MKRQSILVSALLAVVAMLSACKHADCDPAKETCGDPVSPNIGSVSNFSLSLTTAPSNMGAVLFEVSAAQRINVELSAGGRLVRVNNKDAEAKVWRVLLIGGPKSGVIGRVSAEGSGVALPTVTVVEASTDETGQYAPIAGSAVKITATRSN